LSDLAPMSPSPAGTPADGDEPNVVRASGTVRGANGEPLHSARVVVWWQQLRSRKELAAGPTNERGHYHLRARLPENAARPVLIVVEALSEFLDKPLCSPLTPAQRELVIDLSPIPPDQSEWTRLVRSIEPLLDGTS
jgi:hypothetical protein